MNINYILGSFAALVMIFLAIFKLYEVKKIAKNIHNASHTLRDIKTTDRKKIIVEINKLRRFHSDWAILNFADKFAWSNLIVSCLPKLYFSENSKPNFNLIVWKEVLNFIPGNYHFKILDRYCEGQVLKIQMQKETFAIVNEIALELENVRLTNPFNSYISLLGVVNHLFNDYELKMQKTDDELSAIDLKAKRKEFLKAELHLSYN